MKQYSIQLQSETENMMKKKKFLWRVFLYMLLGLAAIALVLCLVYSKAAFAIYKNLTVPKYKLETDMDWTGGQSYEHVPYAGHRSLNMSISMFRPLRTERFQNFL